MLENRQKVGLDTMLPNAGIVAYHVDNNIDLRNNRPDWSSSSTKDRHYHVRIEQADGSNGLECGSDKGNEGDILVAGDELDSDDSLTSASFSTGEQVVCVVLAFLTRWWCDTVQGNSVNARELKMFGPCVGSSVVRKPRYRGGNEQSSGRGQLCRPSWGDAWDRTSRGDQGHHRCFGRECADDNVVQN